MYENLAILAVSVFLYSIASRGLERTPINGALLFAAFGLALGPGCPESGRGQGGHAHMPS